MWVLLILSLLVGGYYFWQNNKKKQIILDLEADLEVSENITARMEEEAEEAEKTIAETYNLLAKKKAEVTKLKKENKELQNQVNSITGAKVEAKTVKATPAKRKPRAKK